MPAADVQIKKIPAVRVAELTALAPDFEPESIGPVAGPLFSDLAGRINAAGVPMKGAAVAYYQETPDGILVHMDEVMPTGQALARWIDENGYRPLGLLREVYLEVADDQANWVTELQAPVTRMDG